MTKEGQHFLVDAGGGNQILKQLESVEARLDDIHDLFVTHEHLDHILGVFWIIRMIGQKMNQGTYEGKLKIYCFAELAAKIKMMCPMMIQQKVCKFIDDRIEFVILESGDTKEILGCPITFFDIASTKAKQFGFSMQVSTAVKFTYVGDEPYNEVTHEFVEGSQWLLHEAFCLYAQADQFKPYEKHHSTVKEACELAEAMQIENLILFHTEEKNLKNRKELYTEEGRAYYSGNLYVPDDLEHFELG